MLVATGCGGDGEQPDPKLRGAHLTIYGSLPQQGPMRQVADDVLRAQEMALAQAGGRVGRYRIRFVPLDAATPQAGASDPSQISENARRAARNPSTVAYLGELATGSSAISIPLLNEAGILQVSPLDTAMTLTTGSSAVTGSPERFYPRQKEVGRTFARVVPSDRSQAEALLASMREQHVARLALLTDDDPSGLALATRVRVKARAAGIAVVSQEQIDVHAREHDEAIARVVDAAPDAILYGGGVRDGAARLWRGLGAADRHLKLFAPASLADPGFVAALGPTAAQAYVTRPVLDRQAESRAGRRFVRTFAARHGSVPAPEALYGYEAMRSVLAAIRRAERSASDGLVTRAAVVRAFFRTAPRGGVLGAYAINSTGDTSLRRWGAFRVVDGRLRFDHALVAPAAAGADSAER